jgi:DNA-binding response OmpR family regulator
MAPVSYLDVTLDPLAYRVLVGDREVPMTPRQCAILSILAKLAGRSLNRTQLLNRLGLWDIGPGTMDVHVHDLRRQLVDHGSRATVVSRRGEYGSGDGPLWSLGARH